MTFNTNTWLEYLYLNAVNRIYNDPKNRIDDLLAADSGETEMVNEVALYKITPAEGEVIFLNRINIYIEEGMNDKFDAALYGSDTALASGIELRIDNATEIVKTLTPRPINKIGQWDLVAGVDMFFTDFPAGASDYCSVRWSFWKGGGPVCLIGDKGEFLSFVVPVDLGAGGAGIVSHQAVAQGFRFRPSKWWVSKFL